MAESMGGDVLGQVLQAMQILSEQVRGLGDRMDRMEARMETQCAWLQRMGLESTDTRDEARQLRLEINQVRERIDRNNDALNLMISGLHRNTAERFEPVEQRLKALEAR